MALNNSWMWAARVAKVVALLLFFVPWLTVSCNDQTLIEATGWQLVTGKPSVADQALTTQQMDSAWWATAGMVVIIAGLAASFVFRRVKSAGRAVLVSSLLAVALLVGGAAQTVGKMRDEVKEAASSAAGDSDSKALERQLAAMVGSGIEVDVKAGFHWLIGVLLVGAACGAATQFGGRSRRVDARGGE